MGIFGVDTEWCRVCSMLEMLCICTAPYKDLSVHWCSSCGSVLVYWELDMTKERKGVKEWYLREEVPREEK